MKTRNPQRVPVDQPASVPPRGRELKAVILAGGLGTRISEETNLKPPEDPK